MTVGIYELTHTQRFWNEEQLNKYNDVVPLIQNNEHFISRWAHRKHHESIDKVNDHMGHPVTTDIPASGIKQARDTGSKSNKPLLHGDTCDVMVNNELHDA